MSAVRVESIRLCCRVSLCSNPVPFCLHLLQVSHRRCFKWLQDWLLCMFVWEWMFVSVHIGKAIGQHAYSCVKSLLFFMEPLYFPTVLPSNQILCSVTYPSHSNLVIVPHLQPTRQKINAVQVSLIHLGYICNIICVKRGQLIVLLMKLYRLLPQKSPNVA